MPLVCAMPFTYSLALHIVEVLSTATKSNTGNNRGEPDLIYFNENKKILILITYSLAL
jgi:hypothetical protein